MRRQVETTTLDRRKSSGAWQFWKRRPQPAEVLLQVNSDDQAQHMLRSSTMMELLSLTSSVSDDTGLELVPGQSEDQDDSSVETVDGDSRHSEKATVFSSTAKPELDVGLYMARREMTPLQERVNALTVVPNPLYCWYFLLAGKWFSHMVVQGGGVADTVAPTEQHVHSFNAVLEKWLADDQGCIHSTWFPNFYALPPAPVVAVAIGITLHAPFSFLYHWTYAHTLPPKERTEHWSRRMDQSMIHLCSAYISYATSGSWDYFLANLMFNADCIYRQFQKKVNPPRNQARIGISILCYTIPILRRGDVLLFAQLWAVLIVGGWLFVKYPLGGWSHSAFHFVVALLPPLLMVAACQLPASQEQMRVAAKCAAGRL